MTDATTRASACGLLCVLLVSSAWADGERHLSEAECVVAGQIGYAAALVRDGGALESSEHGKIDASEAEHPRRELWLVTHDITAFAHQHPELDAQQVGNAILRQCLERRGDLRFAAETEI